MTICLRIKKASKQDVRSYHLRTETIMTRSRLPRRSKRLAEKKEQKIHMEQEVRKRTHREWELNGCMTSGGV